MALINVLKYIIDVVLHVLFQLSVVKLLQIKDTHSCENSKKGLSLLTIKGT